MLCVTTAGHGPCGSAVATALKGQCRGGNDSLFAEFGCIDGRAVLFIWNKIRSKVEGGILDLDEVIMLVCLFFQNVK